MSFFDILRILKYVWPFFKEIVFVSAKERARSIKSLLVAFFFISIIGLAFQYWDVSPYQWLQQKKSQNTNTTNQDIRSPTDPSDSQQRSLSNIENRYIASVRRVDRLKKKIQQLEQQHKALLERKQRLEERIEFLQRENRRLRETIDRIRGDLSDQRLDPATQKRLERFYE